MAVDTGSRMDFPCTSDGPRVYLTGGQGTTAAAAHSRGRISSEPATCAFRPDVTLCISIGRGLAGRAGQPGRPGPD